MDIIGDGTINLARMFAESRAELASMLSAREYQLMESARITLVDLPPRMRIEQYTGAHMLYAAYLAAEERGDAKAGLALRKCYDQAAECRGLENEIDALLQKREEERKPR